MRLGGSVQIELVEGFEEGEWWVQDAAAALSAQILATGIPGGICTIESSESRGTFPPTGTPMTGLTVIDAMTPGRAAATPAMPMNT